ncbi:transcriptional regulator [Saccharopolyspora sp. K220]|uniref:MmyB family transcriptional regulator n=1 Tax=Saccharopolyspora soli TaxID=2926618 RepID=UPI001F5A9529|nr:transcriptional regulator [Saccharopolyspora soli]MCI2422257.1 transcriptional regulator [Saccharopolyspora soli]
MRNWRRLALADALCLEPDARDYLLTIADTARGPLQRKPAAQRVKPVTQQLLDEMTYLPALVVGRCLDVLAWNAAAAALFTDFSALPPENRNMVRLTFLDPAFRTLYEDWQGVAKECVAHLRLDAGRYPDDSRLAALVGELSLKDSDFRTWWASHQVRAAGRRKKTFRHPAVGTLTLASQRYAVEGETDQYLVVYAADPDSAAHDSLRLLGTWSATSGMRGR